MFSRIQYNHVGASYDANQINTALDILAPMITLAFVGGIFGGTLYKARGWAIGSLLGSATGYALVKLRASTPKEPA